MEYLLALDIRGDANDADDRGPEDRDTIRGLLLPFRLCVTALIGDGFDEFFAVEAVAALVDPTLDFLRTGLVSLELDPKSLTMTHLLWTSE